MDRLFGVTTVEKGGVGKEPRLIATLLRYHDYEPISAENGRVGVEAARNKRPDLILCDVMMPELDGFGVLQELQADAALAPIPFIFLTAKGEKADLRSGMNFGWQGQSCGSMSRILLHEDIYETVLGKILDRVRKIKVGHPLDAGTNMGPVNHKAQYEKVLRYIALGKEEGAKLLLGGGRPTGPGF